MPARKRERQVRKRRKMMWLRIIAGTLWVATAVLLVSDPPVGSRGRLLYYLVAACAVASQVVWGLVSIFGDRLHTVAYQVGYAHGRADSAPDGEERRDAPPLRVVRGS